MALVINDSDYDPEFEPFHNIAVHLCKNNQHLFIWEYLPLDEYKEIYKKYLDESLNKQYFWAMRYGKTVEQLTQKLDNNFNIRWDETKKEFLFDSNELISSKPIEKCQLCGGTGIRDFQFYTRMCECKL